MKKMNLQSNEIFFVDCGHSRILNNLAVADLIEI